MEVVDSHLFRVTRNADFTVEEDEADDLLMAIEEELRRRRFGEAVRLEVERTMPAATRTLLQRGLGLEAEDVYEVSGMLDLTALWRIADLDRPELRAKPWTPVTPPRLVPPDEDEPADVFAAIRAGDILVHHPYESFSASVERFITQAADDPDVLTIKQTLYRTSGDSPIVQSLIRAAERGKQVVVLVEIKARFDEEANIIWARKLERAGAHVVYGLVGLKTHSKTALVVRREGSGLRRYVHIGTGNYNTKTARLYVDLGLLTARPEVGADVTDLFNVLTGLSRQRTFRRLLVAPHSLRSGFLELVEREMAHAKAGRPARIVLKLNAIVDTPVIEALYHASQAGVDIELHHPRRVLAPAGRAGRVGTDPGPLDHRGVPRALAHLGVRERRRCRVVHRLGRPHGPQPGPARRGRGAGRGQRCQGPHRRDRGPDARRRPTLVAAPAGRVVGPDRGPPGPRGHDRHVRGAQGAGPGLRPGRHRATPARLGRGFAGSPRVTAEGARPTEVELKYRVGDVAAAERLLTSDRLGPFALTGSGPRSTQMEDRYVDTPDGALQRAGFAVRLRLSGGETIVSIKSLARTDGPGGSVRREELEGPADRVAAPIEWPSSDARALVLEHAGDAQLVERVTVRQLRRKRMLKSPAARVELSLDEVDVVARGRVVDRFVELEAELTKGDEGELEALGRALDAEPALRRALTSKLESALAAVDGAGSDDATSAEPIAAAAEPANEDDDAEAKAARVTRREAARLVVGKVPGVVADDHVAEAGRKVMRFHLARMLDHEPGVREGKVAEDVHKMRVATRRQRAAWRVFGEAYRPGRTKRYRQGLREIARRLGAVRDLDVQLEAADAYRAELPVTEQRALEPLLATWRQHRNDARVLLVRELDSPAHRRWLDDYIDFVRTEGAAVVPVGPVQPHRVRDTAPSRDLGGVRAGPGL